MSWHNQLCNVILTDLICELSTFSTGFSTRGPGKSVDKSCVFFLYLDTVWENIVKSIGHIEVESGNTLAEQIANNDQRAKLLAQIVTLERKMANEKQPRRKREYFEQIKKLKSQI